MDISNTNLGQNIPPKKSTQPLEDNVDDPASPPVQPWKKGKFGSRKRLPESDDSSDDDEIPSSVQPQKKIRLSSEDTRTQKKKSKPFGHKKKPVMTLILRLSNVEYSPALQAALDRKSVV